jgi:hypothetical protein
MYLMHANKLSVARPFGLSIALLGTCFMFQGAAAQEAMLAKESAAVNAEFQQVGSINVRISPDLRLEAFPALSAADDTLRLLDVSHEHTMLAGNTLTPALDVSSSYVWESPRFGQFVLSTNTTYVYNTRITDAVSDSIAVSALPDTAGLLGKLPELQSSMTFSWQIGNHTATATTRYTDAIDNFGRLSIDQLNIDQLNELVGQITTLDLRYGYNLRTGRQGNTSFSVGVRNMFDRRPQSFVGPGARTSQESSERVAYGTIKYQF